jgi:hypothetical protein
MCFIRAGPLITETGNTTVEHSAGRGSLQGGSRSVTYMALTPARFSNR